MICWLNNTTGVKANARPNNVAGESALARRFHNRTKIPMATNKPVTIDGESRSGALVFASSCTYLIPVVAVLWGVLDGETVNAMQILAMGVIIFSVYLINRR